MHLKNMLKSEPVRLDKRIARTSFAEVGNGRVGIRAVLGAATANGVKHFFVKQRQTPGPPIDSLKISFANLKRLNF